MIAALVILTAALGVIAGIFLSPLVKPSSSPALSAKGGSASGGQLSSPPIPQTTPAERDLARMADVNLIKIGLSSFAQDEKRFPDRLAELIPKHLTEIPLDPQSGRPYHYFYSPAGYTLSFSLESGALALSAGDHILTPRGTDLPLVQPASPPTPEPIAPTPTETEVEVIPPPAPTSPDPSRVESREPSRGADADDDGVADESERLAGTDPTKADTDGDGLTDGEELGAHHTDPLKIDTDSDGFSDKTELDAGFDPNGPGKLQSG